MRGPLLLFFGDAEISASLDGQAFTGLHACSAQLVPRLEFGDRNIEAAGDGEKRVATAHGVACAAACLDFAEFALFGRCEPGGRFAMAGGFDDQALACLDLERFESVQFPEAGRADMEFAGDGRKGFAPADDVIFCRAAF